MVMKKYLLYVILLFSVISCKVEEGNGFVVSDKTLVNYGSTVLDTYILPCAESLVRMIDVDEYLSLSPEEQEKSWLHGRIFPGEEESTFIYSSGTDGYLDFYNGMTEIHTRGKSIRETGAEWSAEGFTDIGGLNYYSGAVMFATFRCNGEDSWSVTADIYELCVEMQLEFTGMTKSGNGYRGMFEVSGKETGGDGYVSEFSSQDGPCTYIYEYPEDEYLSGTGRAVGTFVINILKDGQEKDWCMITCWEKDGNHGVVYDVSREPFLFEE